MNSYDIRRKILIQILTEEWDGDVARLAEHISISASELRRTLNPERKSSRNIGDNLARKIEQSLELPNGYLDNILNVKGVSQNINSADAGAQCSENTSIPHVPIRGNTTSGCTMTVVDVLEYLAVPSDDPEAYGLRIEKTIGTYRGEEVLLVEPGIKIDPHDNVIVKMKNGDVRLAAVFSIDDKHITLCDIENEKLRERIDAENIEYTHFIAGCFSPKKVLHKKNQQG